MEYKKAKYTKNLNISSIISMQIYKYVKNHYKLEKYPKMPNIEYDEELLREIEEIIDVSRISSDTKKVPIIYDGRQYTIKIPKRLAESIGLLPSDSFEFTANLKFIDGEKDSELLGKVIRAGGKKTP